MSNHYANAIDVITSTLDYGEKIRICIDYAKRHPKAFVDAAAEAGNLKAVEIKEREGNDTA